MGTFTITLSGEINNSLSIGDTIFTCNVANVTDAGGTDSTIDKNSDGPTLRGTVTAINNATNVITVNDGGSAVTADALAGDMALFAKDGVVNTSGISGYYATVKMKNNSTSEAKLFSVGSEIT
tara:strand:+ start:1625 stop:1993 length:369 start_codon:yes stop_codon:yes gene_type:complete